MSYEIGTATDAADLLNKLNTFLTSKGKAYGLSYTGTGTGKLTGWGGGASSVSETFTITATSATSFNVVGSVSGSIGTATVGTLFTHAKLTFLLSQGSTAFVAGDAFKINTCPPWTGLRNSGGVSHIVGGFSSYRSIYDNSNTTAADIPTTNLPAWLGLKLNVAAKVLSFAWTIYNDTTKTPSALSLEYSDDGNTWTQAQAWTAQTWATAYLTKVFNVSPDPGSHLYWRVKVTGSNGTNVHCAKLDFYTAPDAPAANLIPWEHEAAWSTVGNDGLRQIYVGAKFFWDLSSDYYDWRLNGWTGWSAGNPFDNQAGGMTSENQPIIPLWNSTIPYWFVANGQRVMIFARVNTIYMSGYLGLINTFVSPGQYPYPLFIGGSMAWSSPPAVGSTNWRYSYSGVEMHACWRGLPHSSNNVLSMAGRLRLPDGTFSGIQCYGQTNNEVNAGPVTAWPWANNGDGLSFPLRENLDGSYPLIPTLLSADNGNPTGTYVNTYGEYDGIRCTSGYSNASENTITEGFFTNVVWQDTYRNSVAYFCAFKLD